MPSVYNLMDIICSKTVVRKNTKVESQTRKPTRSFCVYILTECLQSLLHTNTLVMGSWLEQSILNRRMMHCSQVEEVLCWMRPSNYVTVRCKVRLSMPNSWGGTLVSRFVEMFWPIILWIFRLSSCLNELYLYPCFYFCLEFHVEKQSFPTTRTLFS